LLEGNEKLRLRREEPAVINGYPMLAMPSPAPERLKSPFMTWGEVNETPVRLDRSYNVDIFMLNVRFQKLLPETNLGVS
jgi:hypothetical protein